MSMNLEYKIAKIDDLETAHAVFRDAALWLEAKKVDQWQNYIGPDQGPREWIEHGVENREVQGYLNVYFEKKLF